MSNASMPRSKAVLRVTGLLILLGAAAGAICGVLALAPLWLQYRLHPSPHNDFLPLVPAAVTTSGAGAVLGAVLGPTVAWSLLRVVPLWRVLLEPMIGTVLGSFAGWLLRNHVRNDSLAILVIIAAAAAGTVIAALRLHLRAKRQRVDIGVAAIT